MLTPDQIAKIRSDAGVGPVETAKVPSLRMKLGTTAEPKPAVGENGWAVAGPAGKFLGGIKEKLDERAIEAQEVATQGKKEGITGLEGAVRVGGVMGKGVLDVVGEGVKAATNLPIIKGVKENLIESLSSPEVKNSPGGKFLSQAIQGDVMAWNDFKTAHPRLAADLEGVAGIAGGATAITDTAALAGPAKTLAKKGVGVVEDVGSKLGGAKTTLFGRPTQSVDDVIKAADESLAPAKILAKTEAATAKPSLRERWAGVSPDIKNRIAGKQDKLKEYFDVAHARNNFDTLPTPLEYGAKQVDNAVSKMEAQLNDTGSKIGQFRNKVGTYQASIDDVSAIEKTFTDQLGKLNLEVRNGTVVKKPGTITRLNSDSELSVINDLYAELQTIKQAPNLERLIDFRNLFDSKINFAKSARDVSSSLDTMSRSIRKTVADTGARIVGKSEAANLTKYSEFMDAYNQLRSFSDRKAGAEFLLKQALSERGRVPREVMDTIKEFTGIDLMDDATMAQIATDLIGNSRQKGLFRQELTKAGLDVGAITKGNTRGAIDLMTNIAKRILVDEEEQFLKAASQ